MATCASGTVWLVNVYETPSSVLRDGVQVWVGIRGISNVPTLRTSQKSCVGTAGSEGEGAKGLAVCLPISAGMGSDTHSSPLCQLDLVTIHVGA